MCRVKGDVEKRNEESKANILTSNQGAVKGPAEAITSLVDMHEENDRKISLHNIVLNPCSFYISRKVISRPSFELCGLWFVFSQPWVCSH